jgi:hypothetical protein
MLVMTTWKTRPLDAEQTERMLGMWGKIEADLAARTDAERMCWYINVAGTGGCMVSKVTDPDAVGAFSFEAHLAMSEFLEFETTQVLDLEAAMPAILAAVERQRG